MYKERLNGRNTLEARVEIYEEILHKYVEVQQNSNKYNLKFRELFGHNPEYLYLNYKQIARKMDIPEETIIEDMFRLNVDLEYIGATAPGALKSILEITEKYADYFWDNYYSPEGNKSASAIMEELSLTDYLFYKCVYLYYRYYGWGKMKHFRQIRTGYLYFLKYNGSTDENNLRLVG